MWDRYPSLGTIITFDKRGALAVKSHQSPTRSVPNTTPIEAWSGFKPNVQHLKVFRSITYAHVPKAARSKLDDKAEKTTFIGYKHGDTNCTIQ